MSIKPPSRTILLMLKSTAALVSASLIFTQASAQNQPAPTPLPDPEIEVVHWWYKGGDANALEMIVNEFILRGGHWDNAPEPSFADTRESVVSRMAKGYPPTAIQWNAGVESRQFAELGLLNPVASPEAADKLLRTYHPAVLEEITIDGKLYAIPVNLHRENWMWVANNIFESNDEIDIPTTWLDIIATGEYLLEQEQFPIALGSEIWQRRILFNDVLLGVMGRQAYRRFYQLKDPTILDTDGFRTVVKIYRQLQPYTHSFGNGSWHAQVEAIANEKAALLFMGDWASGEFRNQQSVLGVDFECRPAPGNEDHLLPVIDVFLLGRLTERADILGQHLLIDTLVDRDTISAFNELKGSVPPFNSFDQQNFDVCRQQVADLLLNDDSVVTPFASAGDGEFTAKIETAIVNLWKEIHTTEESLIDPFRHAFEGKQSRTEPRVEEQHATGIE